MNLKLTMLAALALVAATPAAAQDVNKYVWGGGDPVGSAYSGVYVPRIIQVLNDNRLSGYTWGGKSDGTIANAQAVTLNPTNLAVGQWDLLANLNGQPIPDMPGKNYAFTVLAENIGPECLYMITDQPGYSTFGNVLGDAWQIKIATGGPLSGSFGSLKVLQSIYPDLADAEVENVGSADQIVQKVKDDPSVTHGFFVMRPDPSSKTFGLIHDLGLTLIPIVDFELEDLYTFQDLKVAYGNLFQGDTWFTTACTSVALITGSPESIDPTNTQSVKRLKATIERIQAVDAETLKPNTSSWRDMLDSMRTLAADKAKELMEASQAAFENMTGDKPVQ